MKQAEQQLIPLVDSHSSIATPATQLLDYVQIRISPGIAAAHLSDRISKPGPALQQSLIDLTYAFNHISPSEPMTDRVANIRRSDLADWVFCMQFGFGPYGDSVQRWRQTHSLLWLVPAITSLRTPDPDLLKAAAQVSHDSPAWVTVTYERLRLLRNDPSIRPEIESVRTELARRHADLSTQNLFTQLALTNATTLPQFMSLAPMQPTSIGYEYDDEGFAAVDNKATMAGLPINTSTVERLDTATATMLNLKLPLSALVTSALESNWHKQLHFELAMAVWTRAVLLDKPEEARRLTPLLIEGEPGWKQWLTAYDNAATPADRTAAALFALTRFPSVRPYINAGPGREEGFVSYSVFRDNWWCANMGTSNSSTDNYSTSYNYRAGVEITSSPLPTPSIPAFITPAMSAEAAAEHTQLLKVGDAPAYFGRETLAWVKAHPKDPRAPKLLGFAFRAMRNGCNLEASTTLRHQIFNTLHTTYPNSEWARHYSNFESNTE